MSSQLADASKGKPLRAASYASEMTDAERRWLLDHLDGQARYVATLTRYARDHASEPEVLLRVRDEVFTLRETLDTLEVPDALIDNDGWRRVAAVAHKDGWPSADDVTGCFTRPA